MGFVEEKKWELSGGPNYYVHVLVNLYKEMILCHQRNR